MKEIVFTNTEISDYAFINREDLTDITLSENVRSIGEKAFFNCKKLHKIKLPSHLEYLGACAFSGCETLEEIVLPKSLKKLNYRTFADCKRLKRIIIPEGIEELDWGVFANCENLEEIVLPNSLRKIDKQLFLNCKKLKKITIPNSITTITDECFKGCINLDITLNSNITDLGKSVFENCFKLSTFPQNVKVFGNNCFKNCRSILNANLNENVKCLPDGIFDGCINLTNVTSSKKLNIGKRCFRNCKALKGIPSFVNNLEESAFENCIGIEKINIIGNTVPTACFRGCKNLKEVNNQENIYKMGAYAFSGCESLESFNLYHLTTIPSEAFSNCINLKNVKFNRRLTTFGIRSFYNCQSLEALNFPDTTEIIKKEAFKCCKSVKTLIIPPNLKSFGDEAFAYMDSLEYIDVSPYNKKFITPDHKILINTVQQKLILYASGLKDKSYSLKNYSVQFDELDREIIYPISIIAEYTFAGAKNLEELTICSCTQDIDATSFYGCPNLKKLNIEAIPLFSCPGFHIRDHGRYYMEKTAKAKAFMPFEEINFTGEFNTIFPNALENFTRVKKINFLTNNPFSISSKSFTDCILLEEVIIPNCIISIAENSFNPVTKLKFANGLEFRNFIKLESSSQHKKAYKLYVIADKPYYIEQGEKITIISIQQIDELCSHSECIRNNPILFLDFINDLKEHNLFIKPLLNGILISKISLESRNILLESLNKNDFFFLKILQKSGILDENDQNTQSLLQGTNFLKVIKYIEVLRKYNLDTPALCNRFLMANLDIKDFESLINLDLKLFIKLLNESDLLKKEDSVEQSNLTYPILQNNMLPNFIRLVKKYNIKDKYLFQKSFIAATNNPLLEEMFKVYDANIKRVLKLSEFDHNNMSTVNNLNDLLVLMKIIGALDENPIIRQKTSTFISEKIFEKILPNGEINPYRIIGDDIHRIFNFISIREELDLEFVTFFLENYQELIIEERKKSGFIQRVYINFRQISKTCTSHKGSQRKLKVTIEKCRNYLTDIKFDNITEENKNMALLISEWYDTNSAWLIAQKVYKESLKAPRNIFTKVNIDSTGNVIYDTDPKNDLKEEIGPNFSYEWLPKQDYDNLILGKYCNCCAHIDGAGQGIMRASMILDNCQNLVIRNNLGEIIAKATIFVNKNKNYAVFNNVESSFRYRDKESLEKIYKAFLRGTKAFIEKYNENNPINPIMNISIGANRNTILDFLTNENNHPKIPIQESLKFSSYSLNGSGYNGDWNIEQRLVLQRK